MPALPSFILGPLGPALAVEVGASAPPAHEFSQSTMQHAMTSAYDPLDVTLVGLGAVIVIVTTIYSVLYLVRPGERAADHIKRRILQDHDRAHR